MIKAGLRAGGLIVAALLFFTDIAQAESAFIDNGDGTVTDSRNLVMWQKSDDGVERAWSGAVQYCDDLSLGGYGDWQLPRIHMIEGLIDSSHSPTIDPVFEVKPSYYWSSSVSRNSSKSAKYVNFYYGNTYAYSKDNSYYVICAREVDANGSNFLTVSFRVNPVESISPLTLRFEPVISGGSGPYFFDWDFSDGYTSSLSNPVHNYLAAGSYKVVLTVTDNDGAVAVADEEMTLPVLAEVGEVEVLKTAAVDRDFYREDKNDLAIGHIEKQKVAGPVLDTELDADSGLSQSGPAAELVVDSAGSQVSEPPEGGGADKVTNFEQKGKKEAVSIIEIIAGSTSKPMFNEPSGQGLFANSLVNSLKDQADWNKDSKISVRELKAYLSFALENISGGKQVPWVKMSGDDFNLCAEQGSTYVVVIGVDQHQQDAFAPQEFAAQSAEAVRKAMEGQCQSIKSMILTGKRTGRREVLEALKQVAAMITSQDHLVFFYSGASTVSQGRLNLLLYDTDRKISSFTGLFYDDLVGFLTSLKVNNAAVLIEAGPLLEDR